MNKKVLTILVILALLFSGCSANSTKQQGTEKHVNPELDVVVDRIYFQEMGGRGSVHKFRTTEHSGMVVTCFVYTGYRSGGISCIR